MEISEMLSRIANTARSDLESAVSDIEDNFDDIKEAVSHLNAFLVMEDLRRRDYWSDW